MEQSFPLGAIPSKPSSNDYSVRLKRVPTAYAPEYQLDMFTNYSQKYGTCVAQSLRGILRKIYGIEFGTAFLYGGARPGTPLTQHRGEGLFPANAADFLVSYGMCPLQYDPKEIEVTDVIDYYNQQRYRLEPYAKKYKALNWARVTSIDDAKAAIMDGKPLAACFSICSYYPNSDGIWDCSQAVLGYHEMLVIGWKQINGKEYAVVFNSWGAKWGKNGLSYISWTDVFRNSDVMLFGYTYNRKDNVVIRRTLRFKTPAMTDLTSLKDVTECQTKLGKHGVACPITGRFDAQTAMAVKSFQAMKRLTADGIVGAKTWAQLDKDPEPNDGSYPNYSNTTLRYGSRGVAVRYLQSKLNSLNYGCGTVDGKFGSKTRAAVIKLQKDNKIKPANGIVQPSTWAIIYKK